MSANEELPEITNRETRWRLVLGGDNADGIGLPLTGELGAMDQTLAMIYDNGPDGSEKRGYSRGGRNRNLSVARWLGDVRRFFPADVVRVMQHDAMERLDLKRLLLEPEILESIEPDVALVGTIMSLSSVIPEKTKATARLVVRKVVDRLMEKLEAPLRSAVQGALDRSQRNNRPRHNEIDWGRTIRRNLRHYQPEYHTIVPETLIGYGRRQRRNNREITLCIDQSGSMANSIVYSGIFGAVLGSIPAIKTNLVVFSDDVVDLTDKYDDPVDFLFGVQLSGGTDIKKAMRYCKSLVRDPENSIVVLISDLIEGPDLGDALTRLTAELMSAGAVVIYLLALSDEGKPSYDEAVAGRLAAIGAPVFACTPDMFPDLMAAAIARQDLRQWAGDRGIVAQR